MNMAKTSTTLPVGLLATSNFLAAIGGGSLLGEARKVAKAEGLPSDTTIALFFGISLGLIVLVALPSRVKRSVPPWCSLIAVFASCALLSVLWTGGSSDNKVWTVEGSLAWLFWLLLVARFAAWFVARIFRTDYAAGKQGRIAWVEFSYFAGTVLGLVIWKMIHVPVDVFQLLVLDVLFQTAAAAIDLSAVRAITALSASTSSQAMIPQDGTSTSSAIKPVSPEFDWSGYGSMLVAFASLTLAVQIVTFAFSGLALQARSFPGHDLFGSSVLAASYLGAALAAYLFHLFAGRLVWPVPDTAHAGLLRNGRGHWPRRLPIVWLVIAIALGEAAYIYGYFSGVWPWTALILIVGVTIAYEVIALALADRIGELANAAKRPGMTATAYAVAALLGTIALVALAGPVTHPMRLLLVFAITCLAVVWGALAWPKSWTRGLLVIADQIGDSRYSPPAIARTLLHKRILPDVTAYLSPRSACYWLDYAGGEARQRSDFEAASWEAFDLSKRLAIGPGGTLRFIGLAVGEGRGEIALLEQILRGPDGPRRIDYIPVDLAPVLLMHHVQTVREVFAPEVESGRLLIAGLVADVFDLSAIMTRARCLCLAPHPGAECDSHERFFADDNSSLLLTFLGNCLGNADSGQEQMFMNALKAALPEHTRYSLILGVSIAQIPPESYAPTTWNFFLADLRNLTEEEGPLVSQHPLGAPAEFTMPAEDPQDPTFLRRCIADFPKVDEPLNYREGAIVGQLYRFRYRLDYPLHLRSDPSQRLEAGETVQVYSIIKYRLDDLKRLLEQNNYDVLTMSAEGVLAYQGTRRYQVLGVFPSNLDLAPVQ